MENEKEKKIEPPVSGMKNVKVETFASDMARIINTDKGGLVRKIIQEEEAHQAEKTNLSPESRKNKLFMFIGVFLIILSLGVLALFALLKENIFTFTPQRQINPIIFLDKTEFREISGLDKDKIIFAIRDELNKTEIKRNGIEGVYLIQNQNIIGFRKFLSLVKANLTEDKITFLNDNFLLGIYNKNIIANGEENKNIFILLKVRSFIDIFDGMKFWEPKMFFDLHNLFGIELNANTNHLLIKGFEDGIIQNKNARILYDNAGVPVLMYVYADDTSVIITDSEQAVKEVIIRLSQGQIKK